MIHYDLTGTKVIQAMDTPFVYSNDNLTPDEKQSMYDECAEWFDDVMLALELREGFSCNVVYVDFKGK